MLKARLIGVVLVRDGIAVQSIGFRRYLPVGSPLVVIDYLDRWGIDEIVVLHIDAGRNGAANPEVVSAYARKCQVPLAVGGGIRDVDTVRRTIQAGADKVVMNTVAVHAPHIMSAAAALFGEQSVVASIDGKRRPDGEYAAFVGGGREATDHTPEDLARRCVDNGAGEIFITSIDCDGRRGGMDLELTSRVVGAVHVPVIACGGVGSALHAQQAIGAGASAVAVANLLSHFEHSVTLLKRQLVEASMPVRLDSYVNYEARQFDSRGRLAKQPDSVLDSLRFRYVAEEVI